MLKHLLRLIFIPILLVCVASFGMAQSQRFVPMDDPVYRHLDALYTSGHIAYLPSVRPYTERQVVEFLTRAQEALATSENPQQERIERVRALLSGFERNAEKEIETGSDFGLSIKVPLSLETVAPLNRLGDTIVKLNQTFQIDLEFGSTLYFGLDQTQVFEFWRYLELPYAYLAAPPLPDNVFHVFLPEQGKEVSNRYEFHVPGETSIVYASNQLNQASIDLGIGRIDFGRQAYSWGIGSTGKLQLSETAKPYEAISLYLPILDFASFSWMTGFLQDYQGSLQATHDGKRLMNAHRLEFQVFKWLRFAIFETVLYSNRFELGYLNPLGLYYLNEVRLGDYDNKLGGAEFMARLGPVRLYTTFFADDWTFSRLFVLNYFNNIFGFNAGVNWYEVVPGLSLSAEFVYLSHWMYTHREVEKGDEVHHNSYQNFGSHLGHPMDPNAYTIELRADYDPIQPFRIGGSIQLVQNGKGTINDDPTYKCVRKQYGVDRNDQIRYSFLDKDFHPIETALLFKIEGDYRFEGIGLGINLGYTFEAIWNKNQTQGTNEMNHIVSLSVSYTP